MHNPTLLGSRPVRLAVFAAFALAIAAAALVWSQGGGAAAGGDATKPGAALSPTSTPGLQVSGAVSRWHAIDQTDNPCTSSQAYVDMPGMTVHFATSTLHQRYIIEVVGEWIGGSDRALLRAVVDGFVVTGPGDGGAPFAPHEGTGVATNGYTFISDDVPTNPFHPAHTVTIQWASVGGGPVCIDERSLVVFHAP
jgi:hypothetical protein